MTTTKKVVKKVAKKVVKPVGKEYHLVVKFNDQVFETDTDDLFESIMAFKPRFLKTKVVFTVTKNGKVCDRLLFVRGGKMIFRNALALKIFISRLIFK